MSSAEQLDFQVETPESNVVYITGRGGFGGEGLSPFPPDVARSTDQDADSKPQSQRKRNPVWDACVEVLGYEPRTDTEKSLWGKMTSSLTRGGATAEQIRSVAEWYQRHWPDMDLTITALEKWFSHFLAKAEKRAKARSLASICPVCEVGGGRHAADCTA